MYGRRGILVRLACLGVAIVYWAVTGLWRPSRRGLVTLCYHAVTDVQRQAFAGQMRVLRRKRLPVRVTFDDGFACLLKNAFPVMAQLETIPTVFIVTNNLGEAPRWQMRPGHPESAERLMSREEIQQAVSTGMVRIGSHTCSHPRLTQVTARQLEIEVRESRRRLEEWTGCEIDELAFPYGDFNDRVIEACRDAGYARLYSLVEEVERNESSFVVGRFLMSPDAWRIEFLLTCVGAYAWRKPIRRCLRSIRSMRRPGQEDGRTVRESRIAGY